jgi:hypothetical protein
MCYNLINQSKGKMHVSVSPMCYNLSNELEGKMHVYMSPMCCTTVFDTTMCYNLTAVQHIGYIQVKARAEAHAAPYRLPLASYKTHRMPLASLIRDT